MQTNGHRFFPVIRSATFFFLLSVVFVLNACPKDEVQELFSLLNQRLELMKEVAAYKYKHQLPIEDKKQEQAVLEKIAISARHFNLEEVSTKEFFRLQIELAKEIQTMWFNHWKEKGSPDGLIVRDLQQEIRPQLAKLSNQILEKTSEVIAHLQDKNFISSHQDIFLTELKALHFRKSLALKLLKALSGVKSKNGS